MALGPMTGDFWNSMVPELTVTDFGRSLAFYRDFLGFRVRHERSNPAFAYLEQETVQLMLEEYHKDSWQTGSLEPPLGRGVNFQIELSDISGIYENLLKARYPLFADIEEEWYNVGDTLSGQREFLVKDPDGYLLRFVEHLGEKPNPPAP